MRFTSPVRVVSQRIDLSSSPSCGKPCVWIPLHIPLSPEIVWWFRFVSIWTLTFTNGQIFQPTFVFHMTACLDHLAESKGEKKKLTITQTSKADSVVTATIATNHRSPYPHSPGPGFAWDPTNHFFHPNRHRLSDGLTFDSNAHRSFKAKGKEAKHKANRRDGRIFLIRLKPSHCFASRLADVFAEAVDRCRSSRPIVQQNHSSNVKPVQSNGWENISESWFCQLPSSRSTLSGAVYWILKIQKGR